MIEAVDVLTLIESLGVEGARQSGDEITAKCPGHIHILGRPDRHASWGINSVTGAHYCFSCGYRGSLESLYRDLSGENPPDDLYERMAISGISQAISQVDEKLSRFQVVKPEPEEEFHWGDLVPVSDRMLKKRYISRFAADCYGIKYDRDRGGWFMPLYSERGDLVGGQWRLFSGPLTLPSSVKKSEYLFGLPVAKSFSTVVVVESPLDAVRLYSLGIPAVSTLGAMVSDKQVSLLNRYWSRVVVAMDNDSAGVSSTNSLITRLYRLGVPCIKFRYTDDMVDAGGHPAKDPGDVVEGRLLQDAYDDCLALGASEWLP